MEVTQFCYDHSQVRQTDDQIRIRSLTPQGGRAERSWARAAAANRATAEKVLMLTEGDLVDRKMLWWRDAR